MKPRNFPGRVQNRKYEAAVRKLRNASFVTGSKEEAAVIAALEAGPSREMKP